MSSGEVRHFGSERKRDNFEKMAEAIKHGFVPTKAAHGAVMAPSEFLKRTSRIKERY